MISNPTNSPADVKLPISITTPNTESFDQLKWTWLQGDHNHTAKLKNLRDIVIRHYGHIKNTRRYLNHGPIISRKNAQLISTSISHNLRERVQFSRYIFLPTILLHFELILPLYHRL